MIGSLLKNPALRGVLVVLSIIFLLFFVSNFLKGKKQDKKECEARKKAVNKDNLIESGKFYSDFAAKLKSVMTGVNFSGREESFFMLLEMNDDEFFQVNNEFNKLIDCSNDSLRNWVYSEYMPFSSIKESLIERFDLLNVV